MGKMAVDNEHRMPCPPTPREILVLSLFFGGLGGALELVIFVLKCSYFDPRNYNVSRQFIWMVPASGLLVIGSCGVLLAVLAKFWPERVSYRLVHSVLAFVSLLGVAFRFPIATAACLVVSAGVAFRLASVLAARGITLDRIARRAVIAVGLWIALAAWLPHAPWSVAQVKKFHASPQPRRNVLLIVLDTFRADRLDAAGGSKGLTPNLARYAGRGVRFERAYATAPWTAPSHASMFTGRWPHELKVGWNHPLEPERSTLAGELAAQGLKTAGFVANTTYCSYETGLNRGFGHYEDYDVNIGTILLCSSVVQRFLNFLHLHPAIEQRLPTLNFAKATRKDASRIRHDFLSWLSHQNKEHFFAFLNFFDVHHPYLSPEAPIASKSDQRILKTWWDIDKRKLPEHDLELARSAYDDCVRYIDREVGLLLDELDRQGRLKETLVAITSDHGEHLGERDLYGHGCSLYDPEVHVPLLLIGEGMVPEGRVVSEPVSLRDLPATVVDLLGIAGWTSFPGESLARTWSGGASSSTPLLTEIDGPPEVDPNSGRSPVQKGAMHSLISGGMRYIRNGNGIEELYTIGAEGTNLADDPRFASELERFRARLREAMEPPRGREGAQRARGSF